MADTARTFVFQKGKLIPVGPPTFLDATSPTDGVGKITAVDRKKTPKKPKKNAK